MKTEIYNGLVINCKKNNEGVICYVGDSPMYSKFVGVGQWKGSAMDDIKDQIDLEKKKNSHRIDFMNNIILEVAKKYNLVTEKKPSFSKILSVKVGDRFITLSQKQVSNTSLPSIIGMYKFLNSFEIIDNYSPVVKSIKDTNLSETFKHYLNSQLQNDRLHRINEERLKNK